MSRLDKVQEAQKYIQHGLNILNTQVDREEYEGIESSPEIGNAIELIDKAYGELQEALNKT